MLTYLEDQTTTNYDLNIDIPGSIDFKLLSVLDSDDNIFYYTNGETGESSLLLDLSQQNKADGYLGFNDHLTIPLNNNYNVQNLIRFNELVDDPNDVNLMTERVLFDIDRVLNDTTDHDNSNLMRSIEIKDKNGNTFIKSSLRDIAALALPIYKGEITNQIAVLNSYNKLLTSNDNTFSINNYNNSSENITGRKYVGVKNLTITPSLINLSTNSSTTIQEYNQNNNTNYIGFSSVTIPPPTYTSCSLLIPTQTTNENMNENNKLILDDWEVYTQNNLNNIWKVFNTNNNEGISSFWYDNQYLNINYTGDSNPPSVNKIVYTYNGINDSRYYTRYHIVLIASYDNVNWDTLIDLNFTENGPFGENGDRNYFNENSNQIEIPFENYHGYNYYKFKEMEGYGYEDGNKFNYFNLCNCIKENQSGINNYNGYTSSNPIQINSTGTGTITIPNGYTGFGNIFYNVNINPPKITSTITSNGYYKFNNNWNGLVSGNSYDYNLNVNVNNKINITNFKLGLSNTVIYLSNLTKTTSAISINVPPNYCLLTIKKYYGYITNFFVNKNNNNFQFPIAENSHYILINNSDNYNYVILRNGNNNIISIYDKDDDFFSTTINLQSEYFNIDID